MLTGRCHCGAITYVAEGEPEHHALCHCGDCRRNAGAPMVGWIAFKTGQVTISGTPVTYESSASGRRQFCGRCGTGLFYTNATHLPGIIDIQSCTLDDPEAVPPGAHLQVPSGSGGWRTSRPFRRSIGFRACDVVVGIWDRRLSAGAATFKPSRKRRASVTKRG